MTLLKDHALPPYKAHTDCATLIAEVAALADRQAADYIKTNADFFEWLAEGSPYLIGLMRRYPDVVASLLTQSPQDYCETLRETLTNNTCATREEWMKHIRDVRNCSALAVGLADVAKMWRVEEVVQQMTNLADVAVATTLDWLFHEAMAAGKISSPAQTGLVVLALGKHGGRELNYSSDIDIVVYYTPDAITLATAIDERKFYISLVRDLAHILQERTQDGYVFRVDLRLRPDPGATQVAISVPAALSYYESMGQNWERAVYIKARPIAGDSEAGHRFLVHLEPYIWRRYFDFASIEDVHSMKRQIHAVRGHTHIAAAGHNIKLGRGGIREIEFFVQTQQLIAGGRDDGLRGQRTIEMLAALADHNWITEDVAKGLTQSYYYLRQIEHRLQMQHDEQTQTLPADETAFANFTHFAGYATPQDFEKELLQHLSYVTQEYGLLFEQGESLAADSGNLVFTGGEDDPDTIETLAAMGFARPKDVSGIIRSWHAGRLRATRSVRSREILTRLTPMLLQSLTHAADPDDAFVKFSNFLAELPSGVQFFSLVQSMPRVLDILVSFITITPHLAHRLSGDVNLLDMLIENR
ncbi:MAG: bifunctional [glutamine synthetase] adenylyltransferase/[glutamine synthetase]-adenylyl-L-tyrosine phosphorylase, partial [Alphaproteobacteria bacterium]|nr:bifunctional [glutamine synthetase] adenylyltransferase/[glutamine synthetase]-adenylyl-L-tyrosine phosphorylase [Alphaproteobacteria bacterium]